MPLCDSSPPSAPPHPCPRRLPMELLSSSSDYGFERSLSNTNKCFANFWFNPLAPPDDCVQGQTYTSSLG